MLPILWTRWKMSQMQIKKFRSRYIFITSTIICLISVIIFHFGFDEKNSLDSVSHFFGGIAVMTVITKLNIHLTGKIEAKTITLMILSVLLFEIFEHLFFCYVLTDIYSNYYLGCIFAEPCFSDTIEDIIFGLTGGLSLLTWRTWTTNRYLKKAVCTQQN